MKNLGTPISGSSLTKQMLQSKQLDQLSWLNKYPQQVKPNSNSEKIILKRFNKDFTKQLLDILNKNWEENGK